WDIVPVILGDLARKRQIAPDVAVVVPNEPVSARRRSHGIQVVVIGSPETEDDVLAETRARQALEPAIPIRQDLRLGAAHQHRPIIERLHPPQVTLIPGAEPAPALAVPMEHQGAVAGVGAYHPDVVL